MTAALLAALQARHDAMLADLELLVATESPSADLVATANCAEVIAELSQRILGTRPQTITEDGRTHLWWQFGTPRVLLLGHFDTVWPLGTITRWPFSVRDGIATGPGAFDMKAGIVMGLHALAALPDRDGVAMLLTSDEEVGSPTSRALIESAAKGLDAVLVLEPSAAGALKVARKGASMYDLVVQGRAAHAGLEPEQGVNALVELSHQILALQALERPADGTTVTPTVAAAGTGTNVVPERARASIDVRAASPEEQLRVDEALRALTPVLPEARLILEGGPNRPPLTPELSTSLFERAAQAAGRLGLPPPGAAHVGGASDGNFTAAIGVPTLDGLGAVGGGAHAEGEHVEVASLAERAALVAALLTDLR